MQLWRSGGSLPATGEELGKLVRGLESRGEAWAQRINEHSGHKEYLELQALKRSILGVFVPNLQELVQLLDAAATDEELAIELIHNVGKPVVAEQFCEGGFASRFGPTPISTGQGADPQAGGLSTIGMLGFGGAKIARQKWKMFAKSARSPRGLGALSQLIRTYV